MTLRAEIKPCIRVIRTESAKRFPLPAYATEGAAGFDLIADILEEQTLSPGQYAVISTGLSVELPSHMELQVRPRSGLAAKHGITVLNSPGTIDADYRGIIGVILINLGQEPYTIQPGARIAQAVIAPVIQADLEEVADLSETTRGKGGYGSTGVTSIEAKN
ncbi:dUTP diphosphatase (plasmid) [Rhizobium bangladeshense]|uniref:dUTP diphosphatase n=1 Tax=Rhizobium bangladeshense TaxID=1138189 RepID=UPI001A9855DF|nr:dUTP diphosphatase [Rhizobium bangladeshense]QSY98610.1 dUTP diphosphatase [Rhizobium bangladeshense]